ncbi:cyclic AMP-responsive element-binding protein 3-like protein 3 [Protopterus annectens]|uniref:cyclic AMP-responsive element-binding protein 3-like protein 3 n=1 Tax=Protopterus annectens TaxID=7888 RepID=UPI001CF9CF77|nr:cyclic AMP-responsive element-binding protein 3-like protein 3 [Protopterus annectens]
MFYSEDPDEVESIFDFLFQNVNPSGDGFESGFSPAEDLSFFDQDMLSDKETEEFLKSILGPFEDDQNLPSASPFGSDSGISEDQNLPSSPANSDFVFSLSPEYTEVDNSPQVYVAVQSDHNYSLQQNKEVEEQGDVLCSVRTETPETDVSIDVDTWETELMEESPFSDQDTDEVVTLPDENSTHFTGMGQDLVLTEEEKRLLTKEGVTLPTLLPLTKSEERILKRVRRKIRNKQSAQESRKKKKQYVDGLESRVAACTAQNQELQKKVQQLQHQNMSLLEQLRKLQAIVKQMTMKTTTTSTCIMVFLLSFCLVIFPSVNPFGARGPRSQLYKPEGVLSRRLRELSSAADNTGNMYGEPVAYNNEELQTTTSAEDTEGFNPDVFNAVLTGGLNHTPEVQDVGKAESGSSINSNVSSDVSFAGEAQLAPSTGSDSDSLDPVKGAVNYKVNEVVNAVKKQEWTNHPTTVIIPQHHSDEM